MLFFFFLDLFSQLFYMIFTYLLINFMLLLSLILLITFITFFVYYSYEYLLNIANLIRFLIFFFLNAINISGNYLQQYLTTKIISRISNITELPNEST